MSDDDNVVQLDPGKLTFTSSNIGFIIQPPVLWHIHIPAGSNAFVIHTTAHLNWWQRMWMKFIGWGVVKHEEN